jgi:putative transposase
MPLRLRRYQQEGHLHFVTFSCYQRLSYLNTDVAYTCFERWLETLRARHDFEVHGYVLMPEHVHMLVSEPVKQSLGNTLRALKGQTSKELKGNRMHFWQKRYHDFNVFSEKKRIEKLRYLHRNPVVRGLVEKPEDWPWSSFRCYSTGERGRVEIVGGPTHPR